MQSDASANIIAGRAELGAVRAQLVDSAAANEHGQGCCQHDGADIGRMLKNAARVYPQFEPKKRPPS